MKNLRVTNGFIKLSPPDLLAKASFIQKSLTANPHFPSPVPSVGDLTESIAAFHRTILAAAEGDRQKIAVRNQAKEQLVALLHRLSTYILFAANGDEVIAQSSGFSIGKTPTTATVGKPEHLVLKNGLNRGELEVSFRRVAGVRAYMYQLTESPATAESTWHSELSTVSKNLFTRLQSGTEYCCRVAAVGANKQVVYSDVVRRIAL